MAGVERSEPPDHRISGGLLTLDPGHPKPDHPNLELLTEEIKEGKMQLDVQLLPAEPEGFVFRVTDNRYELVMGACLKNLLGSLGRGDDRERANLPPK